MSESMLPEIYEHCPWIERSGPVVDIGDGVEQSAGACTSRLQVRSRGW
jgi:hypothetical protein